MIVRALALLSCMLTAIEDERGTSHVSVTGSCSKLLSRGLLAQVKDLAAQVLPLEMVALSSEPAPHPDEALPPAETHQVRSAPLESEPPMPCWLQQAVP